MPRNAPPPAPRTPAAVGEFWLPIVPSSPLARVPVPPWSWSPGAALFSESATGSGGALATLSAHPEASRPSTHVTTAARVARAFPEPSMASLLGGRRVGPGSGPAWCGNERRRRRISSGAQKFPPPGRPWKLRNRGPRPPPARKDRPHLARDAGGSGGAVCVAQAAGASCRACALGSRRERRGRGRRSWSRRGTQRRALRRRAGAAGEPEHAHREQRLAGRGRGGHRRAARHRSRREGNSPDGGHRGSHRPRARRVLRAAARHRRAQARRRDPHPALRRLDHRQRLRLGHHTAQAAGALRRRGARVHPHREPLGVVLPQRRPARKRRRLEGQQAGRSHHQRRVLRARRRVLRQLRRRHRRSSAPPPAATSVAR